VNSKPNIRDTRRHQIIIAARHLVAEKGLEALTFGALEKELSFTRGVITWHFKDKLEIVCAVLDSAIAEMDEEMFTHASNGTFPEKVHNVIANKVNGFLEHGEARQILVAFWSAPVPGTAKVSAGMFAIWRMQALHLFRMAQQDRTIAADVDCEAMAGVMVGVVLGIVIQASYAGPVRTEALIDEAAKSIIARCRRYDPVGPSAFVD
jgi:AcrR family transcriptional regulator